MACSLHRRHSVDGVRFSQRLRMTVELPAFAVAAQSIVHHLVISVAGPNGGHVSCPRRRIRVGPAAPALMWLRCWQSPPKRPSGRAVPVPPRDTPRRRPRRRHPPTGRHRRARAAPPARRANACPRGRSVASAQRPPPLAMSSEATHTRYFIDACPFAEECSAASWARTRGCLFVTSPRPR